MLLKDAVESYLEWKAGNTKKAAVAYRPHLERFTQLMKNKDTREIKLTDFSKFHDVMQLKYAPSNVAYAITILKDFARFLRAEGESIVDPFMIRIPKFTPKMRSVVDDEDIGKMCMTLSEWRYDDVLKRLMIYMLRDTGIRVSELCDLNISDIDITKKFACIVTKKSNKMRYIMWSSETHALLIKYLGVRLTLNQTNPLFISTQIRKRITTRSVERWITQLRMGAGILRQLTPHSFRHYKAHKMLEMGANVKEIQLILGHSEENPRAAFQYLRTDKTEFMTIASKFVE